MLDKFAPELISMIFSYLPAEDLYFLRFLCRAVSDVASADFIGRVERMLVENKDREAFVKAVEAIWRNGAVRARQWDCLDGRSLCKLMQWIDLDMMSLHAFSVFRHLVEIKKGDFYFQTSFVEALDVELADFMLWFEQIVALKCNQEISGESWFFGFFSNLFGAKEVADLILTSKGVPFIVKWSILGLFRSWGSDDDDDDEDEDTNRDLLNFVAAATLEAQASQTPFVDLLTKVLRAFEDPYDFMHVVRRLPLPWKDRAEVFLSYLAGNNFAQRDRVRFLRLIFVERPRTATPDECAAFFRVCEGNDFINTAYLFDDEHWNVENDVQAIDFLGPTCASRDEKWCTKFLRRLLRHRGPLSLERIASFVDRYFRAEDSSIYPVWKSICVDVASSFDVEDPKRTGSCEPYYQTWTSRTSR